MKNKLEFQRELERNKKEAQSQSDPPVSSSSSSVGIEGAEDKEDDFPIIEFESIYESKGEFDEDDAKDARELRVAELKRDLKPLAFLFKSYEGAYW